jgi:hypothetical protein
MRPNARGVAFPNVIFFGESAVMVGRVAGRLVNLRADEAWTGSFFLTVGSSLLSPPPFIEVATLRPTAATAGVNFALSDLKNGDAIIPSPYLLDLLSRLLTLEL